MLEGRKIAKKVGINIESAHFILIEKLLMKWMAAKFMPKFLIREQKELLRVTQNMLDCVSGNNNFLKKIITGGGFSIQTTSKEYYQKFFRRLRDVVWSSLFFATYLNLFGKI